MLPVCRIRPCLRAALAMALPSWTVCDKGFSQNMIYAFTLAQLLIGVLFIVYGYVEVRGWEGLAFMQLGTPIILVSFISFIVYISNSNKVIRE